MKKVGIPKPKKVIKITSELKQKLNNYLEDFKSKTSGHFIYETELGFIAVGYLMEPDTHIMKKVNPVWIYAVSLNTDGTDFVERINVYGTEFEAKALGEMLVQLVKGSTDELEIRAALRWGKEIIIKKDES